MRKRSQSITGYKCRQTDIHIQIWTNIYMTFFPRNSSDQIVWIDLSKVYSSLPDKLCSSNQRCWKTGVLHCGEKGLGSMGKGRLWRFPVYSLINASRFAVLWLLQGLYLNIVLYVYWEGQNSFTVPIDAFLSLAIFHIAKPNDSALFQKGGKCCIFSSSPPLVIAWQGSASTIDLIMLWPAGLFSGHGLAIHIIIFRNQCRIVSVSFQYV